MIYFFSFKARKAEIKSSVDDMVKVEMNLLDLKAEKSAMAIKVHLYMLYLIVSFNIPRMKHSKI